MASDVAEATTCHPVSEAPVAVPKRHGKAKAVVDAVPDLTLSVDEVKKAKQRERMRLYMAERRTKEREAKQPAT